MPDRKGQSFMCSRVTDKCYALTWSYGEICVGCNCCGRINKDRKKVLKARLRYHRESIKEDKAFNSWGDTPDIIALQKKNMGLNLAYNNKKIAAIKRRLNDAR